MRTIARKKKNSTRKWNRTNFFQNEKKDESTRGKYREHPALIFERSGDLYKAIIFTKDPPADKDSYLQLKHNVDGSKDPCYGMRYRGSRPRSDFQPPKKKYYIHSEDKEIVRQLRKPYKNKKSR